MKIIIPASSFLLALAAFSLKGIQWSLDTVLMQLYSIDTVSKPLRIKIMTLSDEMFYWIILIALIGIAIAVASIYNKYCNRIIGVILFLISVMSFLCSLIRI